jgi:hypothetical protein
MARPGAVGLPSGTELIRGAFLLGEEPEHAGRRQSSCLRGGLLVRACLPQPVQQAGHAVRVVEGGEALPGFGPGPRCAIGMEQEREELNDDVAGVRPRPSLRGARRRGPRR